jgi:hypothetical protein
LWIESPTAPSFSNAEPLRKLARAKRAGRAIVEVQPFVDRSSVVTKCNACGIGFFEQGRRVCRQCINERKRQRYKKNNACINERKRERYKKDNAYREKIKAIASDYYKRTYSPRVATRRQCAVCGQEFFVKGKRKICGGECRRKRDNQRKRNRPIRANRETPQQREHRLAYFRRYNARCGHRYKTDKEYRDKRRLRNRQYYEKNRAKIKVATAKRRAYRRIYEKHREERKRLAKLYSLLESTHGK